MNKVIAIVGMTGSGKTEAGEFFKSKGYEVIRFGSVVDEAVKEAGLPWTPENTALYRKKLREEFNEEITLYGPKEVEHRGGVLSFSFVVTSSNLFIEFLQFNNVIVNSPNLSLVVGIYSHIK